MNALIRDALHEAWDEGKRTAGEAGWNSYVWLTKLFFSKFNQPVFGWRTKFDA